MASDNKKKRKKKETKAQAAKRKATALKSMSTFGKTGKTLKKKKSFHN